jgi:transcription initiation factor TFIIB
MRLDLRMPLQDVARCVEKKKLARQVKISLSTRRVATRIVNEAAKEKSKISGRNPMSIAAAALYVACLLKREKKTQKEIAKAADVTVVTLRNNAASLREERTLERHTRLGERGVGLNRPTHRMASRGSSSYR